MSRDARRKQQIPLDATHAVWASPAVDLETLNQVWGGADRAAPICRARACHKIVKVVAELRHRELNDALMMRRG
jgi:hypothetical protein